MYAYADSTGKWKLNFNFSLSATMTASHTSALITLASTYAVTFKNATTFRQAVSAYGTATDTPMTARCNENASTISVFHADVSENFYNVSGDVVLESEPTWAAANMEGVTAVDVYIAPASAGTAGLVNNVAGNTVGTPILGKTDGFAVASGYVGEAIGTERAGTNGKSFSTRSTIVVTATLASLVTYNLNKGSYIVSGFYTAYHPDVGTVRNLDCYLRVGGTDVTAKVRAVAADRFYEMTCSFGAVPITITSDNTAVAIWGNIPSLAGTAVLVANELWITRIA